SHLAFSPDGKTILTSSLSLRLWEVPKPLSASFDHPSCSAACLSPDGKTVLTGDGCGKTQLWEAATRKPLGPPLGPEPGSVETLAIRKLAISPDGKTVLTVVEVNQTGDARGVRLWDAATGKLLAPALAPKYPVVAYVAFSPDGKTLLTISRSIVSEE